jgi:hypothetical protein
MGTDAGAHNPVCKQVTIADGSFVFHPIQLGGRVSGFAGRRHKRDMLAKSSIKSTFRGELRIRYTSLDQLEDLRHRLLRRPAYR